MTYRVRKTKLGYELPEVTSALQKSIRRGEVEHAMWWAQELLRSSYGAYLWRRLLVIASEDVGPAANDMAVVVRALRENAIVLARRKNLRGEDWEAQSLQALHAVVALCLAPKSRLVPEADFVLRHRADSGERLEIPDWALDHHTPAGRRRGLRKGTAASARFWKNEGRTIRPDAELLDNVWRDRFDEILDRERGLDLELPLGEPGEPDP